jgi:hypothetical protein
LFELTQPSTIGLANSIVVHAEHFGWAQRKISELQFPKSAVAPPAPPANVRLFINVFQLLLFAEPPPLFHAVKLLPAVVATWAPQTHGAKNKPNNKNRLNNFIFSL